MKRIVVSVIALIVATAAYLYWTSDERQIRRLLDRVADAVSQEEDGGVTQFAEVAGLTNDLSPEVVLELEAPFPPITGAQTIVSTVGSLRGVMAAVRLDIRDAEIVVDEASASAQTIAVLSLRDREGGEDRHAREVLIMLERRDAGWLITSARVVRAIASP